MKCQRHNEEACGVCANCGRAICRGCVSTSETARLACSAACEFALQRRDELFQLLYDKMAKGNSVAGWFCFLAGGFYLVVALICVYADFEAWPFATFLVIFALIHMLVGVRYWRLGKRDNRTA